MKTLITRFFFLAVPFILTIGARSQDVSAQPEILERGPHHRVERLAAAGDEKLPAPYTVLESGMNYFDENEQVWKPSEEIIELIDGAGIARRGQQKVIFSPNLNTEGSIDLLSSDGKRLRGTVLALVYFDARTGAQVTLGTVKDSVGKLLAPNQMIYEDAFDNIKADVLYTWRKSGLEQDVILRERPPSPNDLGMQNDSTRLQVMTEFFNPPQPEKRQRVIGPADFIDEELFFGEMRMGQGRAFYLKDALGERPERHEDSVMVGKQWLQQDGRTILLESAQFLAVEPYLQNLPEAPREQASFTQELKKETRIAQRTLPRRLNSTVGTSKQTILLAHAEGKRQPGFVLDYETMSNQSNFTFRGDTTYYIDGAVSLSGTTTLEGGAVIKHRPRATSWDMNPSLSILGPFICNTSAYRPAIITAKDDNTVGATISGSDGDPSNVNKFARYALYFYFSQNAVTLKHVRISYAYLGTVFNDTYSYTHTLRHLQFVNCVTPIYSTKGFSGANTVLKAQNILIDGADTAFSTGYCDVVGENLTINDANSLYFNIGASTYSLKNSLLVDITAIQTYSGNTAAHNKNNPTGTIFQSVGAGNFYLANGSTFRNAGVTTIDSGLLSDLRTRTTYPPIELSGSASGDVTLSPVVIRDRDEVTIADDVDLGYHYPAVDYALENYIVSGWNVTVTPGTALIAISDTGLRVTEGSLLTCRGLASAPIQFAPYYLVQEQSANLYTYGKINSILISPYSTVTPPDAAISFTHFNSCSDAGYGVYASSVAGWRYNDLRIEHSEFKGGSVNLGGNGDYHNLFNNLFERVSVNIAGTHLLGVRNNLFYKSSLVLDNVGTISDWAFYNNVFDQTTISELAQSGANSHNGYVGASPTQLMGSGGGDTVVSSFNYASGPFGNFYQSSTDFVNDGSGSAASANLGHFTTSNVNTSKDTGNVDFGYHLPAVGSTGLAYDYDGDLLPDYVEDADGDSTYDAGTETNWQNADTDGDALTDFAEIAGGNFGEADYVDLPGMGANPLHKDIFVEADYYMNYGVGLVSLEPYENSLATVVATFADAPVTNPDGVDGIRLHFDVSDGIDTTQYTSSQLDLDPYLTEMNYFRSNYFTPGRADYFHWCLFAHRYESGGSGGKSHGIPSDTFLVAMGQFGTGRTEHFEALIIMHELGHNLGLDHGGNDGATAKPNYLSIMNPNYCVSDRTHGLKINGVCGIIDYSRVDIASVNERALYESSGFSPATTATTEMELEAYGVFVYGKGWIDKGKGASADLDFDDDGGIDPGQLDYLTTNTDLDNNGVEDVVPHPASQNDWQALIFGGGQIGEGFEALSSPTGIECFVY